MKILVPIKILREKFTNFVCDYLSIATATRLAFLSTLALHDKANDAANKDSSDVALI